MTRTVWPPEMVEALKPEYVAPLVGLLCSEQAPASGQIFEAAAGWFAATRWQRARGVDFEHAAGVPKVEDVAKAFSEICDFDNGKADNPDLPEEGSRYTMGNVLNNPKMVSEAWSFFRRITNGEKGHLKPEDRAERQQRSKQSKL